MPLQENPEGPAFLIRKARTRLLLDHPFFGTIAMGLNPMPDPDCPTAWTDGRILGYRPDYIRLLPFETLKGLVAHLVLHTALGHPGRRKDRDPALWNMACDHTMNWMLVEAGFRLPEGYLDDPELRHLSAERAYALLVSRMEKEAGQGRTEPGSGKNGDGEDMEGEGPQGERLGGSSDTEGSSSEGVSDSGDGDSTGHADEKKKAADTEKNGGGDPGGSGEVRDSDSPGEGRDGDAAESAADSLVAKALMRERDCGDLPASLLREVRQTLEPGMDWRMLLSRFIDQSARSDYAWSPPNRRYLHQGLYLPSVRSEEADRIVLVVDTSGSISDSELDLFCAEVSAILTSFAGEILVMGCDQTVAGVFSLSRSDLPLEPLFTGGGGTDFRAPFRWLEKEGCVPRCLVYLTDLACSHYPEEPDFPVLWAVCGEGRREAPPFGELVYLGGVL